ncbi:ClpX C4-type zinc finger protein [Thiogranum longum]|uniref:ClpX C4-type zinc finger protein n=1 Tax=Thiogranum longum TaxID=1537524 RepID=A0A4R1H944_9GAMM|nr:ClpX C4-type zinc finger protein [Thiogranum longum]
MKSFKVTYNNKTPVVIHPEGLNHMQVTVGGYCQNGDAAELSAWGYLSDDNAYTQYTWLKEAVEVSDLITIECIDSELGDEPVGVEEMGPVVPTCSFCQKTKEEVECLIEAKYKLAHICNECVDVCVGVAKKYKAER